MIFVGVVIGHGGIRNVILTVVDTPWLCVLTFMDGSICCIDEYYT